MVLCHYEESLIIAAIPIGINLCIMTRFHKQELKLGTTAK